MQNEKWALVFAMMIISTTSISCSSYDRMEPPREPVKRNQESQQDFTLVSQCLRLSDNVSVLLKRGPDANSCISQVSSFDNSECSGTANETISAGVHKRTVFQGTQYVGPIDDRNECGELLVRRVAGLCLQKEFISGGDGYPLCYFPQRPPFEKRPGIECVAPYSGKCKP